MKDCDCGTETVTMEETITVEQTVEGRTIITDTRIYNSGPGLDIPLLDDYSDMGG